MKSIHEIIHRLSLRIPELLLNSALAEHSTPEEVSGVPGTVDESAVHRKYYRITRLLIEDNASITTMESCTSGQVASLITDTEGSSAVFHGAFVTYSNESKIALGVPASIIGHYGVYSAEVASAMAQTCREYFKADIGIGITGSLGNIDPNNADSVPGEVYFAISTKQSTDAFHCLVPFQPSRLAYKLYMADVIADILLERYVTKCPS